MNTDASVKAGNNFASLGMVFRDHNSLVLATCAKRIDGYFYPEIAKLLALCDGLQLAANRAIPVSTVECDTLQMINGLSSLQPHAANEFIYRDVKSLLDSVNSGTCFFILRNGNEVAHMLVNFAFSCPGDFL